MAIVHCALSIYNIYISMHNCVRLIYVGYIVRKAFYGSTHLYAPDQPDGVVVVVADPWSQVLET